MAQIAEKASMVKPEAPAVKRAVPLLAVHADKCTGCRMCELACSFKKVGRGDVSASRIRRNPKAPTAIAPSVCIQCSDPACLKACPRGAITKDPVTGIVHINHEKCVPCVLCRKACAYGGIQNSPLEGLVVKCDHCGGDPECVKVCASGALEYVDNTLAYNELGDREDLASPGLSACLGCPAETLMRFTLKFLGPNTVLALGPGCLAGTGSAGFGKLNGLKIPTYHSLLDNYASMLAGTRRAYNRIGKEFNPVVLAGDGGTADVGFQSTSGAAERGENIIYICYDNEGYMNTGIQRSGTTPRGAWTTTTPVGPSRRGKTQQRKDMALLMAMHDLPYVATATVSYPVDYLKKLKRAVEVLRSRKGMVYLHVFSSCPTGWRFPPDKSTLVNKMAVLTNFFPLWECVDGQFRITKPVPFPRPIEEYTRLMGKYSHLNREEIDEYQADVDRRFRRLLALTRM